MFSPGCSPSNIPISINCFNWTCHPSVQANTYVNGLMEAGLLSTLCCVVVDELHMVRLSHEHLLFKPTCGPFWAGAMCCFDDIGSA